MKSISSHIIFATLALAFLPTVLCAVNEYQWRSASFPNIDIDAQTGHITSQSDVRTGSAKLILDISGTDEEAVITADNSSTAQLKDTDGGAADTLVTKYNLKFDGDGTATTNKSGGNSMEDNVYVDYDTFLSGGVNIKYVSGDYDVEVTLSVQVGNRGNNVADSGIYAATQTLTVTWDGL